MPSICLQERTEVLPCATMLCATQPRPALLETSVSPLSPHSQSSPSFLALSASRCRHFGSADPLIVATCPHPRDSPCPAAWAQLTSDSRSATALHSILASFLDCLLGRQQPLGPAPAWVEVSELMEARTSKAGRSSQSLSFCASTEWAGPQLLPGGGPNHTKHWN